MSTSKRELLKKITLATCNATPNVEQLIAAKDEKGNFAIVPLLSIIGIASAFKVGQTDKGEYVRFLGQFKAINANDKTEYVSGACILPGSAPDLIYGALAGAGEGEKRAVEFAFNIGARYDASAVTKYVYTVEQVIQADETDPLLQLERRLSAPALAAPEASPEPEAEKPTGNGKGKGK